MRPTGVGKTTTIAKLAANFRLRNKRTVGLITVDTYRIAAVDQLQEALRGDPRFGEIRVSEIQADPKRGGNTFSLTISLRPAGASS